MSEPVAAGRATLRVLVERLRADPTMLDGAVAAARDQSPPVAALPVQEVRRHILTLLAAVAAVYVDGAAPDDFGRAADQLATDRATQGVPLAALLDGYQAARGYLMRRVVDGARSAGPPGDDLLDGLLELDGFTTYVQNRLIHAYRETDLSLARTAHAARIEALRDLLNGGPVSRIAEAGLDPGRAYHCWVADVTDPSRARAVEAVLGSPGGVSGLVDGYLCGVTARLPDPSRLDGTLVVAGAAVAADRLAAEYRLCAAALTSARARGLRGLRTLSSLAVGVAVDAQPGLGELLAAELLARLDPADEFHRLLAGTAYVYLEHGSRADLAAAALHVHPNTVKHRLRRLAELTAFDAESVPGDALGRAMRWWWALRTWLAR